MKFKIEPKTITTLKGVENFKRWKQEVEMLLNSQGYAYLLKPCPAPKRPTPTSPPPPSEDGQSSSSLTQPTC
jgi:hypothetical protein